MAELSLRAWTLLARFFLLLVLFAAILDLLLDAEEGVFDKEVEVRSHVAEQAYDESDVARRVNLAVVGV